MSTQNVNVARFARNLDWDFFCDFQTPCSTFIMSFTTKNDVKQSAAANATTTQNVVNGISKFCFVWLTTDDDILNCWFWVNTRERNSSQWISVGTSSTNLANIDQKANWLNDERVNKILFHTCLLLQNVQNWHFGPPKIIRS